MKNVNIVSKVVARKGEALASPSKDASTVNLSDFLLKSIWDKVFEFRTDSQGIEYIFGKIPVVTQYGITMYSGDGVDVPSLASGLPFDGRTIWYNPDTNQIEVIGGTGGGSGEGVSNFWDLSGIPSWITISKPKYTYSEIEGTPDLSGFATQNWIISQGYASAEELKKYIPISGYTEVSGEKNFTGGLKVNGSPIYYDTEKKYWKLEGDLLVTGGVTMYGNDSSFNPSTIMDAIAVDGTTISKSGGVLKVIGGVGASTMGSLSNVGTWADSVADVDRIMYQAAGSSSWVAKPLSSIAASGDYLPLSGGTVNSGSNDVPLELKSSGVTTWLRFTNNDGKARYIGVDYNNNFKYQYDAISFTLIHSGNIGSQSVNYATGSLFSNRLSMPDFYPTDDVSIASLSSWYKWGSFDAFSRYAYGIILASPDINHKILLGVSPFDDIVRVKAKLGADRWTDWREIAFTDSNVASADMLSKTWKEDPNYAKGANSLKIISTSDGIVGNYPAGYVSGLSVMSNYVGWQLMSYGGDIENPYFRSLQDTGAWKPWRQIAFLTDNVASATKLQTARTIWGQSFDGTGDVSGTLFVYDTNSKNYSYIRSSNYTSNTARLTIGTCYGYNTEKDALCIYNGNVGIGTTNPQQKLHVEGHIWANGDIAAKTKIHSFGNLIVNGNVGIGTENPSATFHAIGTIYKTCIFDSTYIAYGYNYGSIHLSLNGESKGVIGVNTVPSSKGSSNTAGTYIENVVSGEWMNFYNEGGVFLKANLLVNGGITMYSDQRKKTILNHVELSLKDIANAPLIEHYYNSDEKKTTHVGSIAQYWANMNDWFCKLDSEGYYTMEIQNAALASAISIARELDRYETKTDKAINKLKKHICELEEEVERLKRA